MLGRVTSYAHHILGAQNTVPIIVTSKVFILDIPCAFDKLTEVSDSTMDNIYKDSSRTPEAPFYLERSLGNSPHPYTKEPWSYHNGI